MTNAVRCMVFVLVVGCGVQLPRQQPVGGDVRDATTRELELVTMTRAVFEAARGYAGPCPGVRNVHVDMAATWCNPNRPECDPFSSAEGCSEACFRYTRNNGFLIGIAPGGCQQDDRELEACVVHESEHGVRGCWVHWRYDNVIRPINPSVTYRPGLNRVDVRHEDCGLWRQHGPCPSGRESIEWDTLVLAGVRAQFAEAPRQEGVDLLPGGPRTWRAPP